MKGIFDLKITLGAVQIPIYYFIIFISLCTWIFTTFDYIKKQQSINEYKAMVIVYKIYLYIDFSVKLLLLFEVSIVLIHCIYKFSNTCLGWVQEYRIIRSKMEGRAELVVIILHDYYIWYIRKISLYSRIKAKT